MNPPVPGWEQTVSREPVFIPTLDGKGIAETLWVDVPAWRDPKTNQIFLDGEASDKLDAVKVRIPVKSATDSGINRPLIPG